MSTNRSITIDQTGPLALIQDRGRPGFAHLGVGSSGAADSRSMALANRLVGNSYDAACIEVTFGGLEFTVDHHTNIAVTGASVSVVVGERQATLNSRLRVRSGQRVALGLPAIGMRSYVAIRGGISVPPVLNSRATDTLSGLGPEPLAPRRIVPVRIPTAPLPDTDFAPTPPLCGGEVTLPVVLGPRADWFTTDAHTTLCSRRFQVSSDSNRVGIRLDGPPLPRALLGELVSEGVVCGSLQAPPGGRLTMFLADHPVTGGYPVIGVVPASAIPVVAQLRPGQSVRFSR